MTRVLKSAPRDAVDYSKALPYLQYEPPTGWTESYKEAKDNAPYKPGDCFYIREGGRIRFVRCYCVFAEYLDRRGSWVQKYRVQFATKAGTWSGQWLDTYPGFIQRAYFDEKDQPVQPRGEYQPEEVSA
jgi:hypothetical protein